MSCQPCAIRLYLHGMRTTSHGQRYFELMRETEFAGSQSYVVNLHWSGSDWIGS
jgi:hypothetical protein